MGRVLTIFWLLAAITLGTASLAGTAHARASAELSRCSAPLPESGDVERWLAQGPSWTCPADFSELSQRGHAVKFDWSAAGGKQPAHIVSRLAAFETMTVYTSDEKGNWTGRAHDFSAIQAAYLDRQFIVPIEGLRSTASEVVVTMAKPSQALPLAHMTAVREPPGTSTADIGKLLVIALVCGIILMPLLFDFIFYRVLREPFILCHAAFVLCIALQLGLTAGLYLPFFTIGLDALRVLTVGTFGALVCASTLFIATFLERDALSRRMRRMLVAAGLAMIAVSILHAPGFTDLGGWPATIFYLTGAPVALTIVIAAVSAWMRGSRYVRYLIVGLTPLFLVAVVRIVTFAIPGVATRDLNDLFLVGVMVEALATAFGVAARFVQLKRERDEAQLKARTAEDLAGQDPLTGLMNRRSIEARFATLSQDGYETMAVLDLDHFKQINDGFGHACGDAVLKAVGNSFKGDPDIIPMRIGGEEFLLLIRGKDGVERAERVRQAIPRHVAAEVAGLNRPVTASMGVVCAPRGALPNAGFGDLYEMADKLLYEAKEQGRNRHCSQRIRGFRRRRADRRKSRATA